MAHRTDWTLIPIDKRVLDRFIAEIEEYLRRWAEVDRLYPSRAVKPPETAD